MTVYIFSHRRHCIFKKNFLINYSKIKLSFCNIKKALSCRAASFDVFSVKIGLTDSPVGELKHQKSVVNFEQEGCVFHLPCMYSHYRVRSNRSQRNAQPYGNAT